MNTTKAEVIAAGKAGQIGKIVPCRNGYYYVKFPGVSRARMTQREAVQYLEQLRNGAVESRHVVEDVRTRLTCFAGTKEQCTQFLVERAYAPDLFRVVANADR